MRVRREWVVSSSVGCGHKLDRGDERGADVGREAQMKRTQMNRKPGCGTYRNRRPVGAGAHRKRAVHTRRGRLPAAGLQTCPGQGGRLTVSSVGAVQ